MILGALLDAGAPAERLVESLRPLDLAGWSLHAEPDQRGAIGGTRVRIQIDQTIAQPHRRLRDILDLIDRSGLSERVRRDAAAVFRTLAEAEARVHRTSSDDVHFHEVGAVDSIVDVVGSIVALDLLGVERLFVSSIPLGGGTVETDHGRIPVPAPATVELLARAGAPVRPSEGSAAFKEMVTPTAAAIFAALGTFELPSLSLTGSGYGIGGRTLPDQPNALRVLLGELESPPATLVLLETNVDDQPAEQLGYVLERLFVVGARDAWFTPIQMKKSRPATMLSVIADATLEQAIADLLLRETSTLGVRVRPIRRHEAERRVREVETPFGVARIKVKLLDGKVAGVAPEYEDCRRIAETTGLPLAEVYRIVEHAGRSSLD